jgi:hypothetical protein
LRIASAQNFARSGTSSFADNTAKKLVAYLRQSNTQ